MALGKSEDLDETTAVKFAAAVAEHVRYWEREDIDFQIKEGAVGDIDPQTKQLVEEPAVFLDYYALVTDEDLKLIANWPRICMISLRGTNISDAGLAHLKPLTELRDLTLAETRITDAGLAHLREFKSLQNLDLMGTRVTAAGIRELQAALPELKVVSGL